MSKFRPWAFWRRVQYGAGFIGVWSLIGVLVYFVYFTVPPTCFDMLQNGDEGGVDCDGSCVRICSASVIPPEVVWADSFRVVDGQYNAVAYIENKNTLAATAELRYTFTLYDDGSVIAERSGVTILPPGSVYPIFEDRILTEAGRIPTLTTITLEPVALWQPAAIGRGQFQVRDLNLTAIDTRPRLSTQIENTELTSAEAVEVVATVFDSTGKPLTASRTIIDDFAPRTTREVVFTWPNSIARSIRSCEVPSDIMLVLDRSGSMAASGGTPPEPLESAKRAAQNFLTQAKSGSRVGFLSYATTPSSPIEQTLTADIEAIRSSIAAVTMGTDGTQYTNMGDAFKAALEELESERHREDARQVIIFMTDGDITRPVNPETGELDRAYAAAYATEMAEAAKASEVTIYTIMFGDVGESDGDALVRDTALVQSLATGEEYYFTAPTVTDLERVYSEIAGGLCEDGPTRIDVLPKTATNFTPLR
jgi:Mg-chelatase subunit ChlD